MGMRKRARKYRLVAYGPHWTLEPRDYIHTCIHNKTSEYALSNNIVVSFTILFFLIHSNTGGNYDSPCISVDVWLLASICFAVFAVFAVCVSNSLMYVPRLGRHMLIREAVKLCVLWVLRHRLIMFYGLLVGKAFLKIRRFYWLSDRLIGLMFSVSDYWPWGHGFDSRHF